MKATPGTALTIRPDAALERVRLVERAREYAASSHAERTVTAYRGAWQRFERWCQAQGCAALPAEPGAVALYLTARAGDGWRGSTLEVDLAAIVKAHQRAGYPKPSAAPEVTETLRGIRRDLARQGKAAPRQKAPVTRDELARMVAAVPDGALGVRDRALLLLGFVGAFRRSELVALDVADLEERPEGFVAWVRRSKTDQLGEGLAKAVPYSAAVELCPVRALRAWLKLAKVTEGPIFRPVDRAGAGARVGSSRLVGRAVARAVKRAAEAAGLDAVRFSGHSLRAGFCTQAAIDGKPEGSIMTQTGHRSTRVVRGYVRRANVFQSNAAVGLL